MGTKSKWEYFRAIYQRYCKASLLVKTQILEEFCHVCGYNRKYAIAKLNGPAPPVQTSRKAPAAFAHLQLSSAFDPACHLGGVGLPLVGASESLAPTLVALGQKTLLSHSQNRTPTVVDLGAPDRPQTQREKNPAPPAPLRPHQARHAAQTPYPHQNRFLECQNPRIYRNRSGLALRQLRKGRVYLFPQCHRYLLHVGRKPCRHG